MANMDQLLSLDNLFTTSNLLALLSLTLLEIVLGIDNIIFLSILTSKLPPERRPTARRVGLSLALVARIAFLLSISWIMGMREPLFTIPPLGELFNEAMRAITGRDLVLLIGGLFLIVKSTVELHHKVAGGESAAGTHPDPARKLGTATLGTTVLQILIVDLVFSLDSVITAVGMAKDVRIMIIAVIIAVGVMLAVAGPISDFVERYPTLKVLALSFLLLIGVLLVADGAGQHISKGYVYFAMAFSLVVEMLNIRASRRSAALEEPAT
jgi:predicted tellurium resistance membrane protein TerC